MARASTFPSGIKAVADYVHSRGLKLGIYSDAGYITFYFFLDFFMGSYGGCIQLHVYTYLCQGSHILTKKIQKFMV